MVVNFELQPELKAIVLKWWTPENGNGNGYKMATLSDAQLAYYNGLERKVEEEKLQGSYKEYKKTGEQAMVYEKKPSYRRNKYRERSKTLLQRAMELEVITHCKVEVKVTNRWKGQGAKHYSYSSSLPGVDDMEHVQPPTSPATSAEVDEVGDATTDPRASTPRKRRAVGQALDRNRCRVCGGGDGAHDDASYWWLGCCAKRCTYWTHQRCAGLCFKTKKQLKSTPFYCQQHV